MINRTTTQSQLRSVSLLSRNQKQFNLCYLWLVAFVFLTNLSNGNNNNHGMVAAEEALRRKLNAFTISVAPVTQSTPFQISSVRDSVETLLQTFFQTTAFSSSDTSTTGSVTVDYVGLAAAQVVTNTQSEQLQLTMTGLVYFEEDSDATALPTEEEILKLLEDALTPMILMDILVPIFPTMTMAGLDLNLPEAPSVAPSLPPAEYIDGDTASDEDTKGEDDSDKSVNGVVGGNGGGDSVGSDNGTIVVVGAVVGGLVVGLLAVAILVTVRRRSKQVFSDNLDDVGEGSSDIWKADLDSGKEPNDNVSGAGVSTTRNVSPAKTVPMDDDYDEEEPPVVSLQQKQAQQQQQRQIFASNNNVNNNIKPYTQQYNSAALNMFIANNKRIPAPMHDEDDVSSSLDFNVDELASDYDDQTISVSSQNLMTIPVEPVESFEHERQLYVVKKDMLSGVGGAWEKNRNSNLFSLEDNYNCALQPTDVSAAALAMKRRNSSNDSSSSSSGAGSKTNLIPKLPWWGRPSPTTNNNNNRQRARSLSSADEAQSDGTSYGGNADWDPDELGSMGDEGLNNEGVFSAVSVQNKNEQSLLHHSLRNESYKMQRMRSPDQPSNMSTARRYTIADTMPKRTSSTRGQTPPSALDMGRNTKNLLTLHYQSERHGSGSSDDESSIIAM